MCDFFFGICLLLVNSEFLYIYFYYGLDDETTPPGTPPPPYKIKSKSSASDAKHSMESKRNYFHSSSTPCSNDSVQSNPNAHNLSEIDEFIANESMFNTSTSSAASFGGSSNISAAQPNNVQRHIISMEDDEEATDQVSISGKYIRLHFLFRN